MINRSHSPKRSLRALGLALVAVLAFAGLAASSASALSIEPSEPGEMTGTGEGPALTFRAANGPTYTCAKSESIWNASGGTGGQIDLTLRDCKLEFFGVIAYCTTAGQYKGTIVSSKLNYTVVYLDAAKTKFGYKLTPVSGNFAEFSCTTGGSYKWTGSVLGQITEPALNVGTNSANLQFTASGSTQTYQQVEGAGTSYHLSSSQNGGAPVNLAISANHVLSSSQQFTYLP